jgi:hypothetical protein
MIDDHQMAALPCGVNTFFLPEVLGLVIRIVE